MIIRYPKMFDTIFIDSFRLPACRHNNQTQTYSWVFLCADYLTKFIHISEVHQANELSDTKQSAKKDETDDHDREDYKPHLRPQSEQTWKIFKEFLKRANDIRDNREEFEDESSGMSMLLTVGAVSEEESYPDLIRCFQLQPGPPQHKTGRFRHAIVTAKKCNKFETCMADRVELGKAMSLKFFSWSSLS